MVCKRTEVYSNYQKSSMSEITKADEKLRSMSGMRYIFEDLKLRELPIRKTISALIYR